MATLDQALAFKAFEIEELADVWFFRPLGALIARVAQFLGLGPNQVSIAGGLLGVIAGSLLFFENLGLLAFALLILHGIIDSADGQLARITGQVTGLGEVLDSLSGHVTHAAIYLAIMAKILTHAGGYNIIFWGVLAGMANFAHAQLYVYYRTAYAQIVIEGIVPGAKPLALHARWAVWLLHIYRTIQRRLIGAHAEVETVLTARASNGSVRDDDRAKYREYFYWPVRGWNFLGDNTRFYAIGFLALIHHIDWFFAFILLPMNVALVALWIWQREADRRFLSHPS